MSKVQGGMKCVKYLLFVFNFIFWVSAGLHGYAVTAAVKSAHFCSPLFFFFTKRSRNMFGSFILNASSSLCAYEKPVRAPPLCCLHVPHAAG